MLRKNHAKTLALLLVCASVLFPAFSDDFTDFLQFNAVLSACIGQYSSTEAGGGWYDDPKDYYTPQMVAGYLAERSGSRTRTQTFYGVCFDYAEAAYWNVKGIADHNEVGVNKGQVWLASVDDDPGVIELSSPTTSENATKTLNGVYVRTYGSSSIRNVRTHKQLSGERATHHTWLWVQRADGVWFWIDPTWTDNLGYVVWGCVANGEEVQLRPDEEYCINYPDYLKSLPAAPKPGKPPASAPPKQAETARADSSNAASPPAAVNGKFVTGMGASFLLSDDNDECAIYSFSLEGGTRSRAPLLAQVDWISFGFTHSLLFCLGMGVQTGGFMLYGGGGLGWQKDDVLGTSFFDGAPSEWKLNGGLRVVMTNWFAVRLDVAYIKELGWAGGACLGLVW